MVCGLESNWLTIGKQWSRQNNILLIAYTKKETKSILCVIRIPGGRINYVKAYSVDNEVKYSVCLCIVFLYDSFGGLLFFLTQCSD